MESIYTNIFKRAFSIVRKYKILWLLGIGAAFLGNGGEYQSLINQIGKVNSQSDTVAVWRDNLQAILPNLNLSWENLAGVFITLLIAVIILFVALIYCVSAFGGLIKASSEENDKPSFVAAVRSGYRKFWPLLGLIIIAKAITYGFLVLILTPLMLATFASGHLIINTFIILLIFLIFIPVTIIVSLATKYSAAFVMLENQPILTAFKNGWRLFSANWLLSLEMALILFVINVAAGLTLIVLASLFLSVPFFFGVFYTLSAPELFNSLMYAGVFMIIIVSVFLGSWLSVFQISSWTLLFKRLTSGGKSYSKLVRWLSMLPYKLKRKRAVTE